MPTHLNLAKQKRLVRLGAIFVLVMVLLPNVAYVGHWSPFGETTHAHSLHTEEPADDHAAHCHAGPSQCSGAQSTIGTWWIGDDPNPIIASEPRLGVQPDDIRTAIEPPSGRILRPPQLV